MNVTFYQFVKKENSTKTVSGSGVNFDCIIKSETSIIAPLLEMNFGFTNMTIYNYCYIPNFNRYYFINDWVFKDGLWNATLNCDVLATYKTVIGNSNLYVTRATSDYNAYIIDNKYPITGEYITEYGEPLDTVWWSLDNNVTQGYWIVGVLAKINTTINKGGISYLAFDYPTFKLFCNRLFDDSLTYYDGANLGISTSLAKLIFDPFEYITSVMWLPALPEGYLSIAGFNIGFWDFDIACYIIPPASTINYSYQIRTPKHPQNVRGKYLEGSPYSQYLLFLPRIGYVSFDANLFIDAVQLRITLDIDVISGQGRYILEVMRNVDEAIEISNIGIYYAQIGVQLQLAETQSFLGGFGHAAEKIVNPILNLGGNINPGNIINSFSAIASGSGFDSPHMERGNNPNGFLGLQGVNKPSLLVKFKLIADEDLEHNGRPLCEKRVINTLSGFNVVSDGDIEINGTSEESQKIRTYLEQGFYYE